VKYSIDTSAILDGWRRYYPPDVFPELWEKLEQLIANGDLRATEEVLEELKKKDDDVTAWAKRHPELFVPIDDAIQIALQELLERFERLVNTQRNRDRADPWVIALAQVAGCTVVTGELPSGRLNRPRIPDVCTKLDVPWMNLLALFRREGWVFGRRAR